jgi:transcriptional regulator with XRE-family HTH domain
MTEDKAQIQKTADKLRAARRAKHLTQAEVAKRAGINENHYAQIERGEKNPSVSTFTSIIDAIGVTSADILDK